MINKYDDFYKEKEQSLQEKDPSYKQWKEKQIENKKILFNINNLRRKIEIQNRWIIFKRSVTQKIFYNNFITFAKKCLAQREYFKLLRELKKSKEEQQITLKQLLNAQEMVKARRDRTYFLKPILPVLKMGNENPDSKIMEQCKKEIIENTSPKTPERDSGTLLNVSRCHKTFQMEKLSSILNQSNSSTETLLKQFTADKQKVRILEQVVIPAPVPLKVAKASVQSKSQEISDKLRHCMKRISSSLSQGTISSQKCHTDKNSQNDYSTNKMEATLNASLDDECKQTTHQQSDINEKLAPTTNIKSQTLPNLSENSVTRTFHEKRDDKQETKNSQVNKIFETKQNTHIFDPKSFDTKHIQENMEEQMKEPVNMLPVYSQFFKHPKTVENSVINKDAHIRTSNMQQENEQSMFNMTSQQNYFGNSVFGGNFQFDANISADIGDYSSLRSPVFETNNDEEDINAPAFGNFATETDNNKPQFTFGQSKSLFSLF